MKKRIYFDTSVIGGYYDEKFEKESRKIIEKFFQEEIIVLISSLTIAEISRAPDVIIKLFEDRFVSKSEIIPISKTILTLADSYIHQKVVGASSRDDCVHIAAATITNADYLVSWNFKHIVNNDRIYGYNTVNLLRGYKQIEIISPAQFNLL